MGDLLRQLKKELNEITDEIETEIKVVLLNAVGKAQQLVTDLPGAHGKIGRVDTGFFRAGFHFALNDNAPEEKNPGESGVPISNVETATNLTAWQFGENAFIVNNVEYASYHDLGTIYITPMFLSFQIEHYIERQLLRLR